MKGKGMRYNKIKNEFTRCCIYKKRIKKNSYVFHTQRNTVKISYLQPYVMYIKCKKEKLNSNLKVIKSLLTN